MESIQDMYIRNSFSTFLSGYPDSLDVKLIPCIHINKQNIKISRSYHNIYKLLEETLNLSQSSLCKHTAAHGELIHYYQPLLCKYSLS